MVVAETASMQGTLTQRVPDNFHRLSFTGSGKEYFGIWIVNVLLTIITLGIYSAWRRSAATAISTVTRCFSGAPSNITQRVSRS